MVVHVDGSFAGLNPDCCFDDANSDTVAPLGRAAVDDDVPECSIMSSSSDDKMSASINVASELGSAAVMVDLTGCRAWALLDQLACVDGPADEDAACRASLNTRSPAVCAAELAEDGSSDG